MDADKRKKLESAGFVVGDTQQFLNLSDEEMAVGEDVGEYRVDGSV
ncbi:MAG: hypothetical protein PF904_03375 [Kiritimatiellae bacterium]|jgi:hypothetical protein|nr:hypothetical protein [Kiritimatiellia bacterium]